MKAIKTLAMAALAMAVFAAAPVRMIWHRAIILWIMWCELQQA